MGEPPEGIDGPVAEFQALRSEIDRRSNLQQALLGVEMVAATALASVALANPNNITVLLILPIISLILGAQWYEQRLTIRRIGGYIAHTLHEKVPGGLWWELQRRTSSGQFLGVLAAYGIFPILSFAAIIVLLIAGVEREEVPAWAIVAWIIGVVALGLQIVTWVMLKKRRSPTSGALQTPPSLGST
ncbi:hypothetical protein OG883_31905 [Streptomyces sp. NBC_01142]|uniref:hypothetical protein n=1 Tax=Streptomyces sp. NBC_01142 TaxID=2975865 RepID=UPI00224EBCC4|nr:hypothetical protein [Streptomyces sp. NBC_01142]MCX4824380.1 hypothetical protein [Streptomyces sp. NBC_01142]